MNNSDITKEKLIKFFESGCKKKESWKIGTEHEKFGFRKKNLQPIKFQDIQVIFRSLEEKFGWTKVTENDLIIGLKKNLSSISLEPGGQMNYREHLYVTFLRRAERLTLITVNLVWFQIL